MTRLMQCGWELGDVAQGGGVPSQSNTSYTPSVVTTVPTPRSGTYCLKSPGLFNTVGDRGYVQFSHASKTAMYYAFGYYSHPNLDNNSLGGHTFFWTLDSGGNTELYLSNDGGTLHAGYQNTTGTFIRWTSVTTIGTGSVSIPADAWCLIEVYYVPSITTTGTLEVRVNGATSISVTGVRTAQTVANTTGFGLGFFNASSGSSTGNATTYMAFDDLRVNDTAGSVNNSWPGDEKIVALRPNAAGDSTQFARGGTDSGSNFGQVDETPPNGTTDYVYSPTVGQMDLYNLPTVAVASVSAVIVVAQAFNSDGAGGTINLVTKTGAGQSDGAAQAITGTPTYYSRLLETDPADSGAWSQTKIDALQIGMKVAS